MTETITKTNRRNYIDNIRWVTALIVIVYHIIYNFNSVGVIKNIDVQGIPVMDSFLYFVYPWFMVLLFVVGGMSARYSLEKRTGKEFIRERAKRLLLPGIAGIFIYGWINGVITTAHVDIFDGLGDEIPGFVKFLIYCIMGVGPLWFAHELFFASVVLLIIRKIDKKEKLYALGEKAGIVSLLLLWIAVWISSGLFITPVMEVYRNGIYILSFLLGYYVFSHENVTDTLVKYKLPLVISAAVLGIAYTVFYFGQNYSEASILQNIFTNIYAWIAVLAIIGAFKAWGSGTGKFAAYMTKRNFGFYVLHFQVELIFVHIAVTYLDIPMIMNYIVVLIGTVIMLPIVYELIAHIPLLNTLVLGVSRKK